jgi:hypothetical protein
MFRTVQGLLAATLLSGCATYISGQQRAGLDYFVGKPTEALVNGLGPPTHTWQSGDTGYTAYTYKTPVRIPSEPGFIQPGTDAKSTAWIDTDACTATFMSRHGVVQAWRLTDDACRTASMPGLVPFAERYTQAALTPWGATAVPTGSTVVRKGEFYTN